MSDNLASDVYVEGIMEKQIFSWRIYAVLKVTLYSTR